MIRRPKMGPRDLSIREKAYLHIQQQIPNGNLAAPFKRRASAIREG